jgi:solute carrier family 25, member 33/36
MPTQFQSSKTPLLTCFHAILLESVSGLWRGITPTLVGIIPARAIYFGSYSRFKEFFASNGLQGRIFNFGAAAAAGSLSATLVCPIWVVKTRFQLMPAHTELVAARPNILSAGFNAASQRTMATLAKPRAASITQVALDMYRTEGPRAFFRGLSASYWGISESAIQFALYEECKSHIAEPSNTKYFLAAGVCKFFAAALTYPHEVVRTRMRDQRAPVGSKELKYVHSVRAGTLSTSPPLTTSVLSFRYRSMLQSIATIFREEGARGLYGGMPAHLMRVVPNAAVMFLVVEIITQQEKDA